jgi:hypothetical protein
MSAREDALAREIERNRRIAYQQQKAADRKSTAIQVNAAKSKIRRFVSKPVTGVRFPRAGGGKKHYAVLRVRKIADFGSLVNADRHNRRLPGFEPPNADSTRAKFNKSLIGNPSIALDELVRKRLEGLKIRKNGILASELIISVSPDYFVQKGALGPWVRENIAWLNDQFGDAVVSAELHLDESTPHIHAIIAHEPSGPKSYKQIFGGSRMTLRILQQDYASTLAHLGIERGEKSNELAPSASTLAEHRRRVKKVIGSTPQVPKKPAFDRPLFALSSEAKKEAAAWDKYDAAVKAYNGFYITNGPALIAKVEEAEREKARAAQVVENGRKDEQSYNQLKWMASRLRDIPLVDVLSALGAEESPPSRPQHKSREFILFGEKIAITGQLFTYQGDRSRSGRGAIDLMMSVNDCSYKEAVRQLADNHGAMAAVASVANKHVAEATQEVEQIQKSAPELPKPAPFKSAQVCDYLQNRGIPMGWIQKLEHEGVFYADRHGNIVFPRVGGGAFIRGTYSSDPAKPNSFKRAFGAKEYGPLVIEGDKDKIIVCEGPVTALALKCLASDYTILCLGGNHIPLDALKPMLTEAAVVLGGFDSDKQGSEFMQQLKAIRSDAIEFMPPTKGCDWADELKMNRELFGMPNNETSIRCDHV